MAGGQLFEILVVGGAERFGPIVVAGATVQVVASSRHGGNGGLKRAKARILMGTVDLVIATVALLGHADCDIVTEACRVANTPVRLIRGSASGVKREIAAFVSGPSSRPSSPRAPNPDVRKKK